MERLYLSYKVGPRDRYKWSKNNWFLEPTLWDSPQNSMGSWVSLELCGFHIQDQRSKNGPWVPSRNSEAVRHVSVRISHVQTRWQPTFPGWGLEHTKIQQPTWIQTTKVVLWMFLRYQSSTFSWMTLISQRAGGSWWFLQGFRIPLKTTGRRSMTSAFRRTPMIVTSIANVVRTENLGDRMISDRVWGWMVVVYAGPGHLHFRVEHESPWYLRILHHFASFCHVLRGIPY